jgi:hypothetical protein
MFLRGETTKMNWDKVFEVAGMIWFIILGSYFIKLIADAFWKKEK